MRKNTSKRKENEQKDDPFELPDEGIWRIIAVLASGSTRDDDRRYYFWLFILSIALPLLLFTGIVWWVFG